MVGPSLQWAIDSKDCFSAYLKNGLRIRSDDRGTGAWSRCVLHRCEENQCKLLKINWECASTKLMSVAIHSPYINNTLTRHEIPNTLFPPPRLLISFLLQPNAKTHESNLGLCLQRKSIQDILYCYLRKCSYYWEQVTM